MEYRILRWDGTDTYFARRRGDFVASITSQRLACYQNYGSGSTWKLAHY
jgi:hypothetical protein